MKKMICRDCGSTDSLEFASGFDIWFVALWALALLSPPYSYTLTAAFFVVAVIKTGTALFETGQMCQRCHSTDLISLESPIGRKLAADLKNG